MSYSSKKLSPLDNIRQKTSGSREEVKNKAEENSGITHWKECNESVISFDSIQTTERLLDRLDLSTEDEVLLQQAFKEEENKRKQLQSLQQKRVLCVPASGFPSLRNASGSGNHSNLIDNNSTIHIISGLSNHEKVRASERKDVQLHFSKYRYSYLVEEESDTEEVEEISRGLSNINQTVSIDKFRVKNFQYTSKMDALTETHEQQNTVLPVPHRPPPKVNQQSPFHTPKGSISSIESKFLIKPSTQSSGESVLSRTSDVKGTKMNHSATWNFTTPRKSTSNSSLQQDNYSPSKGGNNPIKTHRKKTSFSLKNLFRSPKVESTKSPKKDNISSSESTPVSSSFRFPTTYRQNSQNQSTASSPSPFFDAPEPKWSKLPQQNFKRQPENNSTAAYPDDNRVDSFAKSAKTPSLHGTQTKLLFKSGSLAHSTAQNGSPKPSTTESPQLHTVPIENDSGPSREERIKAAIDLRNRGYLKESTEQLRVLCSYGHPIGYLLYGLALRNGSGVKQDYKSSFRYLKMAADIHSEQAQVFDIVIDPFELTDVPRSPPEPQAPALYECGISYLKGYGTDTVDEIKGLKYLEKAGSLGHIDSMCLCGTIWSKKSRYRKKNTARAAAWFRLADKRGATLIGADWIYKDKYMKSAKK